MKKSLIVLSIALIMSSFTFSFAGTAQDNSSINEVTKQGGELYFTKEYQKQLQNTNAKIDAYINKKTATQSVDNASVVIMSGGGNSLSVPLYKQEKSYWCGPANAQMTLKYVTGTKYSQSTLATKMGTDTSGSYVYKVTDAMNSYISTGKYQYVLTSSSNFGNSLIYSIDGNRPVVCHTNPQTLPGYTGTATGHYLTAIGYSWGMQGSTSFSNLTYNDSNPDHYGQYTCSVTQMTTAINNKAGYYIRKI